MPRRTPTIEAMTTGVTMLMLLTCVAASAGNLNVTGGNCEQRTGPLGIDVPDPRLAWTLESAHRGERQTAYQILAARDPALLATGQPDLWDSGKVLSESSLGIVYAGKPLTAGLSVWWQVRVWDLHDQPGPYSQPQWWEMALLGPADWHGKWISDGRPLPQQDADFYAPAPAPLLRKCFKTASPIKRARLHVAGLGYHELCLNGRKVGNSMLDSGWTAYDKRVLYATHDVTALLREGDNALGVMLGNGWFNPLPLRLWGHLNLREHLAVGHPRVIVQLNIDYADGTCAQVVTDETWRCAEGPITSNSIYLGEVYDARKELAGWDTPGFDEHAWHAPAIEAAPPGELRAQSQPPVRVTEEIAAIKVSETSPGVFVYDFGQNFTGLARLRFQAAAGTKLVMRYGELVRPDGSLNPMTSVCGQIKSGPGKSVGGPGAPPIAWQTDTYIAKGSGEETYTPRFTYHGFRYIELTGLPAALPLAALTGLRLHSDVANAGSFSCSNERFNRIQQMCRRTFVSNIISVQSDCPHRERLGYGGDIVATSEALMYNFDMATFYQKSVRDWADSVRPDGMLTDTAPFAGIAYCGVGWAMAHPLLISQLYRYHGDHRLLEEQYAIARRWLLLVEAQNPGGIIKSGLGDHESLVPAPVPPLVTPLYYQSARILTDMARILGRTEDVTRFNDLAEHIRKAYQHELLDPKSGVAGPGSQACQAVALYSGLLPDALRAQAVERLVDDIRNRHKSHLSTGIAGTKFLLDVLSTHGQAALAFTIANQPDFPGWGWMLDNGATTLWEHWAGSDNTYSNNHPMFGSISQWFFNCLGGIRPAEDAVGFDKITIAPQPIGDLQWVKATYQSARGPVTSEWKKDGERFILHLAVPFGATATVAVPATDAASVTEGGKPSDTADGVRFLRMERGAAVFTVGGGSYDFVSR